MLATSTSGAHPLSAPTRTGLLSAGVTTVTESWTASSTRTHWGSASCSYEVPQHLNWHRYYDPVTGRYLQPEPMLADPGWVVGQIASGMSTPVYAYAGNNPIVNTDPDGLTVNFNLSHSDIEALWLNEGLAVSDLDKHFRDVVGEEYAQLSDSTEFTANVWSVDQFGSTKGAWRIEVEKNGAVTQPIAAGSITALDIAKTQTPEAQANITRGLADKGYAGARGPPIGLSPTAYIGHELGHAWSYMQGNKPGSRASIAASLRWENRIRLWQNRNTGPRRLH